MAKITLRKENENLREEISKNSELISDLKSVIAGSGFNKTYYIKDNLRCLIDDYNNVKAILNSKEGRVDAMVQALKEENTRLYYIVRVMIGDKTIEKDEIKPGESYDHDYMRLRKPF